MRGCCQRCRTNTLKLPQRLLIRSHHPGLVLLVTSKHPKCTLPQNQNLEILAALSLSLPGSSMLNICSGKRKANECMYQHCKLGENEGGRNCCARLDRRLAQENGGVEKKNSHTPRLPPPAFEYTLPTPRLIKPQPAGVARDAIIDTTQPTLNPTASH